MKYYRTAVRCVCVAAAVIAASGQTQIDLRTQGKNIDFSTATSTRPSKTGTSLPATCSIGETYLKTDAVAGKNLYVCTGSGVWTVQGGEGVPNPAGKSDQVLGNDGTGALWQALGGDVTGRPGAVAVTGLSGRKLSSVTPLDGQFLKWNGVLQRWEATTLAGALSVFGRTGAIVAQTGDYGFAQIAGIIAGSQLPAASGDLSGGLSGPTVVKLQSRPVSPTTPLTGQSLTWDGAQWNPQTIGSGATTIGSGAPAGNCTPPAMYIDTSNQDLWFCGAANVWKKPAPDTSSFPTLSGANAWTGFNNLVGAQWRAPESTVAILPPAAGNTGKVYIVTDAASTGTCSVGSGNARSLCRSTGTIWESIGGGGGSVASPFSSLHSGFTLYTNPEPSVTGTVSYTDYSSNPGTVYKGLGIATYTEPVSISRVVLTVPAAFRAAPGAPSITALQLSVGTLSNATAYLSPVQIGYTLSGATCAGGLATFTTAGPVPTANQTATVVVSGVVSVTGTYNQSGAATWTTSTTFTEAMTCPGLYTSGGMAGLQGLVVASAPIVPAALTGSQTMYVWLTEVNVNPANFLANLTAGSAKVTFGGVQLQ